MFRIYADFLSISYTYIKLSLCAPSFVYQFELTNSYLLAGKRPNEVVEQSYALISRLI